MSLDLPRPLGAYFEAVNAHDADRIALCFAPDAIVHDERQDKVGRDAIRAWAYETGRRYGHTVKVLHFQGGADRIVVTGRVAGYFPGSPIELCYRFTLGEGLIRTLEIS